MLLAMLVTVVAPQYGLVNASGLVQTRTGDNDDGNYNNIDNDDNDEKKSGTWEEYASTDLFLKIINEMITSDGGAGYTFLLFSNSKVIKKRIVDTFPKNTVYALNYDDDKEGLMDRASTRSVQEGERAANSEAMSCAHFQLVNVNLHVTRYTRRSSRRLCSPQRNGLRRPQVRHCECDYSTVTSTHDSNSLTLLQLRF